MRSGPAGRFTVRRAAALLLCAVMGLALLLPVTANAQSAGKTVRVGWFESPFNTMSSSGRRSGYAYEYQQKIAAYTGWSYEYVEGSWPELMQMLTDGEIDLLSDVSYTQARAEQILYSDLPMGAEEYYIFVSPENREIRPDEPRTLEGKRIGVNKGSVQAGFYQDWAQQYGVQAELVEWTGSDAQAMERVRSGALDAFLSLDAYGDLETAVPLFRVGSSDIFFALNRARPDLLSELNAAMSRIQAENRFFTQQLSQKYISTSGANLFLSTEEMNWLSRRHDVIRVGYLDNYLAFCAADRETGALTGALKDYLDYASVCFSNAGIRYEAAPYPTTAAAMQALKNGEVDCIFPSALSTADGEALGFVMTPAIMSTDIYALVRRSDRDTFPAKDQVTAAIQENDPNDDALMEDNFPNWQSVSCPDLRSSLKAVAEGSADCVLISNYQYNSLSKLCEEYKLLPLATGESTGLSFAVNLGDNTLYSILTRTTNLVSDTATFAALSYYSSEDAVISVGDFIHQNPVLVGSVTVAALALVTIAVIQHRLIVARKEVDESRHRVQNLNEQVFVDALTHVRNKRAYAQWEEKINAQIKKGDQEPFAVVVCDVNNLKDVNDLYGHKEGDACIKNACARICGIFAHSPVFRIGGDEFVVFLSGVDYDRRKGLMDQINAIPRDRSKIRIGETVAAGMADFHPERHNSVLSVFEEADKAMYERKQFMKESLLPREDQPEHSIEAEYIPDIHTRKQILIVDDIEGNRELMGDLLAEDYDVLYAADGVETLEVLRSHKGEIDLVLLDLQMPNMDGRQVIAQMQVDEDLMSIPVVFLTVDQAAELDCLHIGAMDFIPKPYPDIEIVKARIAKCIELSENRELIRYTERDKLTGLLNKDYFYRYVNRLDHLHMGDELDAVVCDVNRFHAVNKQYGRQFGDSLLRSIGAGMNQLARRTGGISCREESDTFLLYCPHQEDYEALFRAFRARLSGEKELPEGISLRFGVFLHAQQEPDPEERFVRGKIAADRVKDDPGQVCGFYALS